MDIRLTILERLKAHPAEIHSMLDGLPSEQLKERPSEHTWSLHELAMHLCETQDVFIERVARMLTEERPEIVPYEPDEARKNGLYFTENLPKRMKEFDIQRTTLISLLHTLSGAQWKLEGRHPEMKHYSIEKAMESFMRHEEHHLYQMFNVFFGMGGKR